MCHPVYTHIHTHTLSLLNSVNNHIFCNFYALPHEGTLTHLETERQCFLMVSTDLVFHQLQYVKNSDLRHVTVGNILLTDQKILSYYDFKNTSWWSTTALRSSCARQEVSFKSPTDVYYCTEHICPVNETPRNKHFTQTPAFTTICGTVCFIFLS